MVSLFTLYKDTAYNDEPQLFQYTSSVKRESLGGGLSFNKQIAKKKAIFESLERYCLEQNSKSKISFNSTAKLKRNFLNPSSVVALSDKQKGNKRFKKFVVSKNSTFGWIDGKSLIHNNHTLIPAQLVFVPYRYKKHEPILRLPISTGAALGTTIESAIVRGIYEVIERDSFIIYYLDRLTPKEINFKNSSVKLKQIKEYFNRYDLDLRLFDITSDLGIPVIMATIIDQTGIGPCISIGLKAGFLKEKTAIGAIEEAQHSRGWMRDEKSSIKENDYQKIINDENKITDAREHGLFWYEIKNLKKLDFWLKGKHQKTDINGDKLQAEDFNNSLDKIKEILKMKEIEAYFVDIAKKEVSDMGLFVIKAIIPQLQPLYLNEQVPYFGGGRLYNVPAKLGYKNNKFNLNKIPHPFL